MNNKIYDNGSVLLGRKKDILEYTNKEIEHFKKVGDDYVVETFEMILEEVNYFKDYSDDMILAVNYDNGMSISIDFWEEKDVINNV